MMKNNEKDINNKEVRKMREMTVLLFTFVSFLLLMSTAKAEDYISKDFPSNAIIAKNIDIKPEAIIGKMGDGSSFTVYYRGRKMNPDETGIWKVELWKMDTNLWLFYNAGSRYHYPSILQK